jgi:hypothetical protein
MQADYDVRGTLHATGDYFFAKRAKPENSDGTQILEKGVDGCKADNEEAQGRHVEERPLGQEGQEPQAGDCDRSVGGESQGQEGAEEGIEKAQDFKEEGGQEIEALERASFTELRHARACPGHPRCLRTSREDVDGRDKARP